MSKLRFAATAWTVTYMGFTDERRFDTYAEALAFAKKVVKRHGEIDTTASITKAVWLTDRAPLGNQAEPMKSPGHAGTGGSPPGGE